MARLENICDLITELFKEYDTDSDGKLSKEEVEKLVENEVTDDEIKAKIKKVGVGKIMGRMDKDRDGAIDMEEFSRLFIFLMRRCYHKKTGKGRGCDSAEDC